MFYRTHITLRFACNANIASSVKSANDAHRDGDALGVVFSSAFSSLSGVLPRANPVRLHTRKTHGSSNQEMFLFGMQCLKQRLLFFAQLQATRLNL